jgi:hypothetical protein
MDGRNGDGGKENEGYVEVVILKSEGGREKMTSESNE